MTAELIADHLWQSTLFLAIVALLTLMLSRRDIDLYGAPRAVRHQVGERPWLCRRRRHRQRGATNAGLATALDQHPTPGLTVLGNLTDQVQGLSGNLVR
jgi:hypothetical protein